MTATQAIMSIVESAQKLIGDANRLPGAGEVAELTVMRELGAHQSGDGVGGLVDLGVGFLAAGVRGVDHAVLEVIVEQT